MTKSLVNYLLGAAEAIFEDHFSFVPQAREVCRRDLSRLSSLCQTRGLPTFTLDLPALGKHFDKCLSEGRYTKLDGPLTSPISAKIAIPKLFSGLLLAVFDANGVLRVDACVHSIATLRQLYSLGKKYRMDCSESATVKTVADFYAIEEKLPPPFLNWGAVDFNPDPGLSLATYHGQVLPLFREDQRWVDQHPQCQTVFDIVTALLGPLDLDACDFKHGPGAVSDLKVGHAYKYAFPTWSERLDSVFPLDKFAYANFSLWATAVEEQRTPMQIDVPSRLIAVPKTQKGPRLIASEPTANQWCQQALLDFLRTQIKATWLGRIIHLNDQTYNQRLAMSSSRNGSHWTVDLSSASDYVTCRFIERAFRKNPFLLKALNASRTHFLFQDLDKKSPSLIPLKKFSTMGSACTFPVQSIVFACLALAAMCQHRRLKPSGQVLSRLSREVLIFGDDIIIPSDSGPTLEAMLNHFGFKVNSSKTFRNGKFRESCGVEAYDGVDVTPSYILSMPSKRRPASIVSAIDTSNNFFLRGYWRTASYLQSRVPPVGIPVVAVEAGCIGYKTFCPTPLFSVKEDKDLQKAYVRGLILSSKAIRTKPMDEAQILQYFTEAPPPEEMIPWESGYSGRPRLNLRRGRVYVEALGRVAEGLPRWER